MLAKSLPVVNSVPITKILPLEPIMAHYFSEILFKERSLMQIMPRFLMLENVIISTQLIIRLGRVLCRDR